jgi:hypothetical protein
MTRSSTPKNFGGQRVISTACIDPFWIVLPRGPPRQIGGLSKSMELCAVAAPGPLGGRREPDSCYH